MLSRLFLFLSLALLVAAQDDSSALSPDQFPDIPKSRITNTSIYDFLVSLPDYKVLVALLDTFNFTNELSQPSSRVTLLAPRDVAFSALAKRVTRRDFQPLSTETQGIIDALVIGFGALLNATSNGDIKLLLQYHMLNNETSFEQLDNKTLPTRGGVSLEFSNSMIIDGDPKKDTIFGKKDFLCTNGFVHQVRDVLLPYDLTAELDNVPRASPAATPVAATAAASPVASPVTSPIPDPDDGEGESTDPTDESEEYPSMSPTSETGEPSDEDGGDDGDDDDEVCFPASATVTLADGSSTRMDALAAGDRVRHAHSPDAHSPIFLFTHRSPSSRSIFLSLSTSCTSRPLELSPRHYLYANGRLTAARAVVIGDVVEAGNKNSRMERCVITDIRRVTRRGVFAPHSLHGDLVVEGVRVSSYSMAVHPRVAHALLAPLRSAVRWMGVVEPLGTTLYEGADWALPFVPAGSDKY